LISISHSLFPDAHLLSCSLNQSDSVTHFPDRTFTEIAIKPDRNDKTTTSEIKVNTKSEHFYFRFRESVEKRNEKEKSNSVNGLTKE